MTIATGSGNVLVLDFGSQVTQLIARRVREAGVYCEIQPCTVSDESIRSLAPSAIILSGGPASTTWDVAPRAPCSVFEANVPILGICYGEQTICAQLGGSVETSRTREFGRAELDVTDDCLLFDGVWKPGDRKQVWMSHGDKITAIPAGFRSVATSDHSPYAVIADERRQIYGVQFHPEVVHTPDGASLLKAFLFRIAGLSPNWSMEHFRDEAVAAVRRRVGSGRVIMGVSGGVDSTVAAALVHEAIGDRLVCVFVDHGLLREDEAQEVRTAFAQHVPVSLIMRDSGDLFLQRLAGVADPEEKRKIIGSTFIEEFETVARSVGDIAFLGQGTLYPDVIESVSFHGGPSTTIKSHHNVGGLPERMNLQLVEPLRELFKDEVRNLGMTMGLPRIMLDRHPFPGPGLAIRIPGEVTQDRLEMLRKADAIFIEEIRAADLYGAIWQAFVVLLPVRSVGVMGDDRTYEFACALRAVTSVDGMTADSYPFEHNFLRRVAGRIVNEVPGINRVTYDVSSKPPGTIEWE